MRRLFLTLMAGLLLLPVSSVLGDWDPEMPAKWVQLPDLDITGIDINASPMPEDYILADDFECREFGALTEIHLWGSWLDDSMPMSDPGQVRFTLSIHADIPADQSPTGFSMPGEVLWWRDFQAHDFMVRPYMEQIMEGWMDPPSNYFFPADFTCWQYNFHIPQEEAFIQEGTPDQPVVYWLDVKAFPEDGVSLFGWKTSLDHWNDDAVWGRGPEPYQGPWEELIYPANHEMAGQSIDLAFVINGIPLAEELDFGDAPDPTYPTFLASNGPRHVVTPLFLGALIDAEPNGQPHPQALGDDLANLDDEDGVLLMSPLIPGQSAQLGVTASQPGLLDAWIDFNGDGTFTGLGEQIFVSHPLTPGPNILNIIVPAGTAGNRTTVGRFRVSSNGGLSYDGVYPGGSTPDGEIEDHQFFIEEEVSYKWFQKPDLDLTGIDVNASHLPEDYILADDFECTERGRITEVYVFGSWLHDNLPAGGNPNLVTFTLSFHGDIPASQNPDGYSMPADPLWTRSFQPGDFEVRPYAQGIEEGWFDPPQNYLPPPADTVCWLYKFVIDPTEAFLQEGTLEFPMVYWLDVEATPLDDSGPLFGWKTTLDHWNDDAVYGIGMEPYFGPWWELRYPLGHPMMLESIDLAFGLVSEPEPVEFDWGDASDPTYPTLAINNGPRHVITPLFLGSLVDAELDGQPQPQALGDDLANLDDEDGVQLISPMIPGQSALLGVTASQPGLLDAWIDWNGNGSWADPGDQIFASQTLNTGTNNLTVMVPAGIAGNRTTVGRFRVSANGGLSFDGVYPDGSTPDGEIEDHELFIDEEISYKWYQAPDLDLTGIDVNASEDYILADDFLCTERGRLIEIHVFGSWLNDWLPGFPPEQVEFTLSIHEDIPAEQNPDGYSIPGVPLWTLNFQPGSFEVRPYAEGIAEGWLDPPQNYLPPPADTICWQYTFFIDAALAFLQEGTTANPVVYWLDLEATPLEPGPFFGWKTSLQHWNDDAVWGMGEEPYPGPWWELRYPEGHPMYPESIDLAFGLISEPVPLQFDWGDASDPSYPTLAANNGPRHRISSFHLGALIDAELDGQPTANAMGDDLNGVDDEDGVTFTSPLIPARPATVDIIATQPGHIDAWIDYNANGSFADPGEQIFVSLPLNAGLTNMTFNVPSGIAENTTTTARFRASPNGGLSYDGVYPDGTVPLGEVEDLQVFLSDRLTSKWMQPPDLSTMGIDVCANKFIENPDGFILADDFLCTTNGPITDIHVWGSWNGDILPNDNPRAVVFTLSIHADIPANESPTGYSMPGELLWLHTFEPTDFEVEEYAVQIEEGWMYPPGDYHFPADTVCWLYKFHAFQSQAFIQEGTATHPVVYWLDVQAEPLDPMAEFGWKTSIEHWNDDAVWGWGNELDPGPWGELIYPPGHQMEGLSIDLAFALFEDSVTPVPEDVPVKTGLLNNVPNPFNPATVIHYMMPDGGGDVRLEVFDARGRLVRTLVDGFVSAGPQAVEWNGRDNRGLNMPSGVYFYRLDGPDGIEALKMLLLR